MSGEIKDYALNQMNHTISGYNKTGYEASTQTWNLIQSDVNIVYVYYLLNSVFTHPYQYFTD